jgi:hypothetical protein
MIPQSRHIQIEIRLLVRTFDVGTTAAMFLPSALRRDSHPPENIINDRLQGGVNVSH